MNVKIMKFYYVSNFSRKIYDKRRREIRFKRKKTLICSISIFFYVPQLPLVLTPTKLS